jgi:tricarballylate dehydrogenase
MQDSYDIVVIGAGSAASVAALTAAETNEDLDVAVLERAPEEERGGNSRYTDAWMRLNDDGSPAEGFVEDYMEFTEGLGDAELMRTVAENAKDTVEWLEEQGLTFDQHPEHLGNTRRPRVGPRGGGQAILDTCLDHAEGRGVDIHYETTAEDLALDDVGELQGVIVRDADGARHSVDANAVVIASGGFEGNPTMLAEHLEAGTGSGDVYNLDPVAPGGEFNKGEGIVMAQRAGAATSGQFDAYHNEPVDPRSDTPAPAVFAFAYGILVNKDGERFIDEGAKTPDEHYEYLSRRIREQPDEVAYLVFDQKVHDVEGWDFDDHIHTDVDPYTAEPDYASDVDPLESTLRNLAESVDVDVEQFVETVQEYNENVQEGEFRPRELDGKRADVDPPKSNWALRFDTPPFAIYPMVSANVFTFGGLAIDTDGRVVNNDDRPIHGLYAAGEVTGFYYRKYTGGTSVLRGLVFGRLAGQHAAEYVA